MSAVHALNAPLLFFAHPHSLIPYIGSSAIRSQRLAFLHRDTPRPHAETPDHKQPNTAMADPSVPNEQEAYLVLYDNPPINLSDLTPAEYADWLLNAILDLLERKTDGNMQTTPMIIPDDDLGNQEVSVIRQDGP